jgi:hypothetical protein
VAAEAHVRERQTRDEVNRSQQKTRARDIGWVRKEDASRRAAVAVGVGLGHGQERESEDQEEVAPRALR